MYIAKNTSPYAVNPSPYQCNKVFHSRTFRTGPGCRIFVEPAEKFLKKFFYTLSSSPAPPPIPALRRMIWTGGPALPGHAPPRKQKKGGPKAALA